MLRARRLKTALPLGHRRSRGQPLGVELNLSRIPVPFAPEWQAGVRPPPYPGQLAVGRCLAKIPPQPAGAILTCD